jgi:hypothetical protein
MTAAWCHTRTPRKLTRRQCCCCCCCHDTHRAHRLQLPLWRRVARPTGGLAAARAAGRDCHTRASAGLCQQRAGRPQQGVCGWQLGGLLGLLHTAACLLAAACTHGRAGCCARPGVAMQTCTHFESATTRHRLNPASTFVATLHTTHARPLRRNPGVHADPGRGRPHAGHGL